MHRKGPATCAVSMLALELAVAMTGSAYANTSNLWQDIATTSATASAKKNTSSILPSEYRSLTLDFTALRATLAAPIATALNASPGVELTLPLPEGGYTRFKLTDSGTLPASLAQRFPQIRSLKGIDEKGRQLRLDVDDNGMQAMVFDPDGVWLVQPGETLEGRTRKASAKGDVYLSYRRADLPASAHGFSEPDGGLGAALRTLASRPIASANQAKAATGSILYDYRLAVAATSAYSKKFSGSVQGSLAGVVRTINRVNEVFERDLGVHLTLVADNDKIIFTDPGDDPYQGLDQNRLLAANVKVINKVIGSGNFDVGHLLGTEPGGVVGKIGNTCLDGPDIFSNKASGYTGSNNPVGDAFNIDYVAHELGHQFGGWHTFNGCSRTTLPEFAFEPGSGSTIMGYAGICESHNLQEHTDPYFHAGNLEQVQHWLVSEGGRCATRRLNPYPAPWIDPDSMTSRTIPALTPFTLSGAASFGNPDARRTYVWEQMDTGPEQTEAALKDDGQGPIFRSWSPDLSGTQSFPSMAAILGNKPLGPGEVYPSTSRDLNFRLTVRDDYGTQSTSSSANLRLQVVNTGRAFAVVRPNQIEIWRSGSRKNIQWGVADTDKAPIGCRAVNIHLSLNGGYDYLSTPLRSNVPNNGHARITIPELHSDTTQGRVKVSCADNIFFAVSPTDIVLKKR